MSARFSIADVTAALGVGPPSDGAGATFTGVTIDSRGETRERLFVALRGPRFDGNDFVAAAVEGGALGVVAAPRARSAARGVPFWPCDDGVDALQRLAGFHRRRLSAQVIAVTGSNGKTTTKELVYSVLSQRFDTCATQGNLNNHIGTPLTLLDVPPEADWAVIEIGTSEPGEVARLAALVEPDMGVITNVAASHLEGLGTIAEVLEEKMALGHALGDDGVLFYNGDDPRLRAATADLHCRTISYGLGPYNDVAPDAWDIDDDGRGSFEWEGRTFRLRLVGKHNVINALAAVAIGREADISAGAISVGVADPEPLPLRMQLERWACVVALVDCYNANPQSVLSAASTLGALPVTGRRIAVLGEMRELGSESHALHEQVGASLRAAGVEFVVCVGPEAAPIADGAESTGLQAVRVPDRESAVRWLVDHVESDDALLFKASRGAVLEEVVGRVRDACLGCSAEVHP